MSFERFVSFRYLRAKRKQKFISLISVISVLGVAVGVMALIVVLSVYTGFTEGLRDQIIGINAHVMIHRPGSGIADPAQLQADVEAVNGVQASTPNIYGQALITSGQYSSGIAIRGIDPATAGKVLTLESKMVSGRLIDLADDSGLPLIFLGRELATQLRVDMGWKIRLLSPNGTLTPMGVLPKVQTCVVGGIFATGMYEYDSTIGFVTLETARRLVGIDNDGVQSLELRVKEIDKADAVAAAVREHIGPSYLVRDWKQANQNLFAALKLEKVGIFIALALIILVASLNIISALVMVVMEKNKDIAILKSMGASTGSIMRIFFYQGAVIGFTGTVLGVGAGLGLCSLLKRYKIIELPSNVYPMSTLPIKVVPDDIIVVAIVAVLITLLATLYPSWKASRIRPADALTYE
ncbi:lipoprotein-releasing system permease protein [Candidatus Electrothrix marina]|uniref:Lipoprotein-releasing system permease protein n=2 Tax=Candidatus Electrothrix marina TaxID=1859130 RepID=A0A444JGZ1_9BACT|nr:lipoprotein-releasing system permease protein [Candidatus Electrothrix marina]RWX52277.1 lipoprotein-releasing system permease protein [Candidatus Electrothrix marina]